MFVASYPFSRNIRRAVSMMAVRVCSARDVLAAVPAASAVAAAPISSGSVTWATVRLRGFAQGQRGAPARTRPPRPRVLRGATDPGEDEHVGDVKCPDDQQQLTELDRKHLEQLAGRADVRGGPHGQGGETEVEQVDRSHRLRLDEFEHVQVTIRSC